MDNTEVSLPPVISYRVDEKKDETITINKDIDTQELINIIDEAQTYLPDHAVRMWDNLQKVKVFLEGLHDEKDA